MWVILHVCRVNDKGEGGSVCVDAGKGASRRCLYALTLLNTKNFEWYIPDTNLSVLVTYVHLITASGSA